MMSTIAVGILASYLFGIGIMFIIMQVLYCRFLPVVKKHYTNLETLPIDTLSDWWQNSVAPFPVNNKFNEDDIISSVKVFNRTVKIFWLWVFSGFVMILVMSKLGWLPDN